ncbi:GDP-mannose 4,6-dehydratase [Alphaproteobacteria bacterium]|nr:GDP-mannose 4,6-dehydratase [Alphaproteobacteria bacterium]MDC0147942.1 GDP-mannose 4,6-dehydratase [Alphaproteobacteria bacterium]
MTAQKTALITGITGQDGAYLAQLLVQKNYRVVGASRRASTLNLPRLAHLDVVKDIELCTLDVLDPTNFARVIEDVAPDEIYNLGGQSSVQISFQQPVYTSEVIALGTLRMLEMIHLVKPDTRVYNASSSEIFGHGGPAMVTETTPFQPRSPYGVAKLYAHWAVVNYREAYNLFAASGILFNHESPLRGMDFVTRKITATLSQIACGGQQLLTLGNLDNARDWGFAGDYVEAMWRMLQQDQADDFIIASGVKNSVRDFVELAAQAAGLDLVWEGEGENEIGVERTTGRQLVGIDAKFYRPSEPDALVGDIAKARKQLQWQPSVTFEGLVEMMVEADMARARHEQVWF